ncbi:helix-turn-helix domain-containing protein [Phenylobacterium sp.]|uniref:helix-turn-helix domain-containing protein n=1 Tax=Phenylobacterium sp. TaxID=1871053 RepID=UPI003BAA5292
MSALHAVSAESAILSQTLRLIRRRRGLRQIDVAKAMGLAPRTYQHFEAGRTHLDFEKIKSFAAATNADPNAIVVAVLIGSPAFALRSIDNKLTSALMTALRRFDDRVADDIARIEVGRLIAAFRRIFTDLETDLAARDALADSWLNPNPPPNSTPDGGDDET